MDTSKRSPHGADGKSTSYEFLKPPKRARNPMGEGEKLFYMCLLMIAIVLYFVCCKANHPPTFDPVFYGEICVNDTTYRLEYSQDTIIQHRTPAGKVNVYQLENYTYLSGGRRISAVFTVELDTGERVPYDRVTQITDGQLDAGGSAYYQSSPSPAGWLHWGTNGDRIVCQRKAGKLQVLFQPVREWNGRRRILRGYITQP